MLEGEANNSYAKLLNIDVETDIIDSTNYYDMLFI